MLEDWCLPSVAEGSSMSIRSRSAPPSQSAPHSLDGPSLSSLDFLEEELVSEDLVREDSAERGPGAVD